jgi:hypothetical protein
MMTRRKDQAGEDARTIARVQDALLGYAETGAASVSVVHVLDLLNPRGLWSHDPGRGKTAQEAPMPVQEQGVDPLTGCRPASAPQT